MFRIRAVGLLRNSRKSPHTASTGITTSTQSSIWSLKYCRAQFVDVKALKHSTNNQANRKHTQMRLAVLKALSILFEAVFASTILCSDSSA